MTEETKSADKFDYTKLLAEFNEQLKMIKIATERGDRDIEAGVTLIIGRGVTLALASIADSLQRIAKSQETIAHLTNIDLDATIQEGSKILYAEMKAKENAGNAN